MSKRRVVVTGLGVISPVGNTVSDAWDNVLAGHSGITRITRFDASALASQIAGEVKDFDVTQYLSAEDARRMDIFIHYGMAAGVQAVRDAGIENVEGELLDAGTYRGQYRFRYWRPANDRGYARRLSCRWSSKISPFFIPSTIINMIAGNLSIMFGFKAQIRPS